MSIAGLTVIGETIHDSVPSTHTLFEKNDNAGIVIHAKSQVESVVYNVGLHSPGFIADIVRKNQEHKTLPLSINRRNPEIAAAGLEVYNPECAGETKADHIFHLLGAIKNV